MNDTLSSTTTLGIIPAYIKAKYPGTCKGCFQKIEAGTSVFYTREGNQLWHGHCGHPDWKASGTPYAIRKSEAIKAKAGSKNASKSVSAHQTPDDLMDQVEALLEAFRAEGTIVGRDLPVEHDSKSLAYLLENELVDGMHHYTITGKGKAWKREEDRRPA